MSTTSTSSTDGADPLKFESETSKITAAKPSEIDEKISQVAPRLIKHGKTSSKLPKTTSRSAPENIGAKRLDTVGQKTILGKENYESKIKNDVFFTSSTKKVKTTQLYTITPHKTKDGVFNLYTPKENGVKKESITFDDHGICFTKKSDVHCGSVSELLFRREMGKIEDWVNKSESVINEFQTVLSIATPEKLEDVQEYLRASDFMVVDLKANNAKSKTPNDQAQKLSSHVDESVKEKYQNIQERFDNAKIRINEIKDHFYPVKVDRSFKGCTKHTNKLLIVGKKTTKKNLLQLKSIINDSKNELNILKYNTSVGNADPEISNKLTKLITRIDDALWKSYSTDKSSLKELYELYSHDLSTTPAVAVEGINDPKSQANRANLENFINLHPKEIQPAIRAMIDLTEYVSFSEFNKSFDAVIEHLNESIKPNEHFLVMVKEKKSNKWLAEKGIPKLKTPPRDVINLNKDDLLEALKNHPNCNRIVLFDDASYSGEQMSKFLNTVVIEALKELKRENFTINIGIPYQTQWAKEKLTSINKSPAVSGKGKIDIAPHKTMRSMAEIIPKAHHKALIEAYFPHINCPELATIFDAASEENSILDWEFFPKKGENTLFNDLQSARFPKIKQLEELHKNITVELKKLEKQGKSPHQQAITLMKDENISKQAKDVLHSIIEFKDSAGKSDDVKDLKEVLKLLEFEKGLVSRALTVFDHKVADGLSIAPSFEDGTVWSNGQILLENEGTPYESPLMVSIFKGKAPYK